MYRRIFLLLCFLIFVKVQGQQFTDITKQSGIDHYFEVYEGMFGGGIAVLDYNNDGFEDIIISGNIYNTEVETPRLDNQFALVLVSNNKNGYYCLSPEETGLYTNGNTKSIQIIDKPKLLIVGNNNGAIESFKINSN